MSAQTPKYKIIATGNTYAVKGELVDWQFRWHHADKQWVVRRVDQGTMNLLRHRVSSGAWDGVELHITEETA